MSCIKTSDRSYVVYHRDLEYLFAVCGILGDFEVNPDLSGIYPTQIVEVYKKRHPLLFEVFGDFHSDCILSLLEYIKSRDMQTFSADQMFQAWKDMGANAFLQLFFEEPTGDFEQAITDKAFCYQLYQKNQSYFTGFFGFCELVQNTMWVIGELEQLFHEIQTEEAEAFLLAQEKQVTVWQSQLQTDLADKNGEPELLAYSQGLFGKTFFHTGPFDTFYFMPSLFLPCKIVRWYGVQQFLSFNVNLLQVKNTDVILEQLKTLSDKSRYRILLLIKEKGTISGLEIADKLSLAPSTVSHHMSGLRSAGLIHEENDKNVKYYSINQNAIRDCIETLEQKFLK